MVLSSNFDNNFNQLLFFWLSCHIFPLTSWSALKIQQLEFIYTKIKLLLFFFFLGKLKKRVHNISFISWFSGKWSIGWRHWGFSCLPCNVSEWIQGEKTKWSLDTTLEYWDPPNLLGELPICPSLGKGRKQEIASLFCYLPLLYASNSCKTHLIEPAKFYANF